MIRKLLMILAVMMILALIADYYGIISLPSFKKSTTLETRDRFVKGSEKALEDILK